MFLKRDSLRQLAWLPQVLLVALKQLFHRQLACVSSLAGGSKATFYPTAGLASSLLACGFETTFSPTASLASPVLADGSQATFSPTAGFASPLLAGGSGAFFSDSWFGLFTLNWCF